MEQQMVVAQKEVQAETVVVAQKEARAKVVDAILCPNPEFVVWAAENCCYTSCTRC